MIRLRTMWLLDFVLFATRSAQSRRKRRPGSKELEIKYVLGVRKWWNWQTHHLEGVAPKGVGVQIPPSAPELVEIKLVFCTTSPEITLSRTVFRHGWRQSASSHTDV
jgi:hypothetical protein